MAGGQYQICTKCIMDTIGDDAIHFNAEGVCNYCTQYKQQAPLFLRPEAERESKLKETVEIIKRRGKDKPYDCIIGVSGGVDSTYVAYLSRQLGLRPLAIHLDNGWNSELAVGNIEKILNKLNIDLSTRVLDWNEFRELQLSFLRASVPDGEIPTDHAIFATLFEAASKHGISYIISGTNYVSESPMPAGWTYGIQDWTYIRSVHRRFSKTPLKDFPHYGIFKMYYYAAIKKIKVIRLLDNVDYNKLKAVDLLQHELGWKNYGGKHYESVYTRFFQGYVLPRKFSIDKRKSHLSTLICSSQLSREQALVEIKKDVYGNNNVEEDLEFVVKKLNISRAEFDKIMADPPKNYLHYPNGEKNWNRLRSVYRFGRRIGIFPKKVGFA